MKNQLFYGDNLDVLRKYIKDESIDLCYIDPPFNSKRNYNQIYLNQGGEDKAQAQAFVDTWNWGDRANDELQELFENSKGLYTKQTIQLIEGLEKVLTRGGLLAYLISMTLRIAEIHRVLKDTGSFYLHCDPTASHYLKLVCDGIFCAKGGDLRNEIIWCYSRMAAKGQKQLSRCHDVVFWYNKGKEWSFDVEKIRLPYAETSKARAGYKKTNLGGGSPKSKICELNEGGKFPEDWVQIPFIRGHEYLGYQTQKPEALLERFVLASSNKGDTVLDAYCGCGTTIAVAEDLKRNWIGVDITYQSISLVLRRLTDSFGKSILKNIELNGIPQDFESAVALANKQDDRTRKEFEKWCILSYTNNKGMIHEKKGKDYGIDGMALIADINEKQDNELMPVLFSVKSDLKPHSSYVRDLIGTMQREKAVMGILITLYEPTRDMITEAKQAGKYKNKLFNIEFDRVKIVTVSQMLKGDFLNIPQMPKVLKEAKRKQDREGQLKFNIE